MRTVAVLAVAMGGLLPAAAGIADSGDGQLGCNAGEICFSRDSTNTTYQKHFYYSGTHDNYVFTNVTNGIQTTNLLKNNADQVRNRDSTCDVKVIDDRGAYPDDVQVIPNNGIWTHLATSVRNQNERHERAC